jgi:hypothetical protein
MPRVQLPVEVFRHSRGFRAARTTGGCLDRKGHRMHCQTGYHGSACGPLHVYNL